MDGEQSNYFIHCIIQLLLHSSQTNGFIYYAAEILPKTHTHEGVRCEHDKVCGLNDASLGELLPACYDSKL